MATAALLLSPPPQIHRRRHLLLLRLSRGGPPLSAARLCGQQKQRGLGGPVRAIQKTEDKSPSSSAEEITEKYGLELGLWKIFSSKEGGSGAAEGEGKNRTKADLAKELLAKYGGAYLATSITLSLISFSICYLLVGAGIDVQALLNKIGIMTDETGGKVGVFALAYAAHKAASPIRFPPTVALTPVVAGWIGKKKKEKTDE